MRYCAGPLGHCLHRLAGVAEPEHLNKPQLKVVPPESLYTAEQERALEGLARLIVEVLNRALDEQRPDLRRRRIKSF